MHVSPCFELSWSKQNKHPFFVTWNNWYRNHSCKYTKKNNTKTIDKSLW